MSDKTSLKVPQDGATIFSLRGVLVWESQQGAQTHVEYELLAVELLVVCLKAERRQPTTFGDRW
jgi:hypothetical protein